MFDGRRSETLKDRKVCHGAKREAFGNGVVLGLPYSILALTADASSSWAMTVNSERVKPEEKAVEMAVKQIESYDFYILPFRLAHRS
jgi:hypothetical protein